MTGEWQIVYDEAEQVHRLIQADGTVTACVLVCRPDADTEWLEAVLVDKTEDQVVEYPLACIRDQAEFEGLIALLNARPGEEVGAGARMKW